MVSLMQYAVVLKDVRKENLEMGRSVQPNRKYNELGIDSYSRNYQCPNNFRSDEYVQLNHFHAFERHLFMRRIETIRMRSRKLHVRI